MTYTIPEAAIRAAGHALRTRSGVDFDGWDGEAEIALRAALPHLQPTVPNTVDALDALTVGSVIRAECPDGTYVAELAQEGWDLAGYSYPSSAGNLAAIVGVTEWTIVWSPPPALKVGRHDARPAITALTDTWTPKENR